MNTIISKTKKFTLLADLGTITVPNSYSAMTRLKKFREKYYGNILPDENNLINFLRGIKRFPNPSHAIKRGDKLRVRAFRQVVGGETTAKERMAFLDTKKAIYIGSPGLVIVFEQKRKILPKDFQYISFDRERYLLIDSRGSHRMLFIKDYPGGDFSLSFIHFKTELYADQAFFCFNKI